MKKTNVNETDIDIAKQRVFENLAARSGNTLQQHAIAERYLDPKPAMAPTRFPEQFPIERGFTMHQEVTQVDTPMLSKWQRCKYALTAPGLGMRQRLRALPLLGYAISVLSHAIRAPLQRQQHELRLQSLETLPARVENLNRLLNDRIAELAPMLDQTAANTEHNLRLLEARISELEGGQAAKRLQAMENLDAGTRLMRLEQVAADRKLKQFSQMLVIAERENQALREQITSLAQQLQAPAKPAQQSFDFDNQFAHNATAKQAIPNARADAFFKHFEDQFRGSRDEIKQRLSVYLPYFQEAAVEQRGLTIDVGCGRGEWLELLAEHQIPALGVDLNAEKVAACIELGYAAKVADAVSFLRQQEPGSVFAVTGFHIVEHLPFEVLLDLFDAALHALKPEGLLIFETPNPENLLVGACNFYFDPTHLHPLVPAVLQFVATHSGFTQAEIKRLHPYPDDHLARGDTDADRLLNRYLFGPQDYALLARK